MFKKSFLSLLLAGVCFAIAAAGQSGSGDSSGKKAGKKRTLIKLRKFLDRYSSIQYPSLEYFIGLDVARRSRNLLLFICHNLHTRIMTGIIIIILLHLLTTTGTTIIHIFNQDHLRFPEFPDYLITSLPDT